MVSPVLSDSVAHEPVTQNFGHPRRAEAYRLESDPIKTEVEFDSIRAGVETDYSAWLAKVEEIKARYPLPRI
ncbi:hypothetical protein [Pseudomonas aeruginosa]|uniref:hypothetical protein n=1 Tax=Pseudomonas aeruginosa TaxID=287 RepID=UPI003B52CC3E